MTPETQRDELLASARAALELEPDEIDRAHDRFVARLDADAQRGAWRNTTELRPFLATWLRTLVLGVVGVSLISLGWWRCPLHEESVAKPREHFDPAEPRR
jgi:hypothetical protein